MNAERNFFEWLVDHLDEVFSDAGLQSVIGPKLATINPKLRWEAGPYDDGTSFFAFSPNLYPELLPVTDNLVQVAPNVPGWIFLSGKPRKEWTSRFITIIGADGSTMSYDINPWRYYLVSFNDGEFFDVNLIPYGCEHMPIDDLRHAASLFVEFELGERQFMELIDRTNVVLPQDLQETSNKVEDLYDQVQQQRVTRH